VAVAMMMAVVFATSAQAVIPAVWKVAQAVAEANRKSGRTKPILLEVTLTIGEGQQVAARGTIATHPTGLARLELKSDRGFVERHLLQGTSYTASRNGAMIPTPRHFLPPVFLLQARSGEALTAAMASFGIATLESALGRVEDFDCFVFGGRLPRASELAGQRLPSMWVDLDSFDVVRVDGRDGVSYRFGPAQAFGKIRVPRWIAIEAPGEEPVRLDIVSATNANAPAAAFGQDWLLAPAAR
jgi:hypothetical protein